MATNATTDGLGGEEVNQAINITDIVSGGQLFATGSVQAARVCDGDGIITSANLGSPTAYGYRVQAGFITTAAGSEADIDLGISFSAQPYALAFGVSGNDSAATPTVSGVQTISGCTVIGDASTVYSYIAVGPA